MKKVTQKQVKYILSSLIVAGIPEEETAQAIVCALVGHSKIQETYFGEWTCGRCGEVVGDSLGGAYQAEDVVIIRHDCDKCFENYKKLTWRDKLLTPYPFTTKSKNANSHRNMKGDRI